MKQIAAAGLFVVAVLMGALQYRSSLARYGEVGLPPIRFSPTIPLDYEYVHNCERVQQILADSPSGEPILILASLSGDEIAIYKVILDSWDSRGPIKLSNRTFPLQRNIPQCECLVGIEPASIIGASNSFRVLKRSALRSRNVRLVDPDSQTALIQANAVSKSTREEESSDAALNKAFANGLFRLSEIAFDKGHLRALVSYSYYCGPLCGSGRTLVLEKLHGVWKENSDHRCAGWIS